MEKCVVIFFKNGGKVMIEGTSVFNDNETIQVLDSRGKLLAYFRWECLNGFLIKEIEE